MSENETPKPLDVIAVRDARRESVIAEVRDRLNDPRKGDLQVHPTGQLFPTGNQTITDPSGEVVYQTTQLKRSSSK